MQWSCNYPPSIVASPILLPATHLIFPVMSVVPKIFIKSEVF